MPTSPIFIFKIYQP